MLSVLVVSPDPAVPGGVSVFIASMKRHLARSRADSFVVGSSGHGGESTLAVVARLVTAPLALVRQVKNGQYDAVHINPSFDAKSLVRDGMLLLALRAAGFRRVLFYFHGWDVGLQQVIERNAALRLVVAWVLNRAALVTVLGDTFRDGLVAMGVDAARIAVTRTMYEPDVSRRDTRPPLRPFILFLSRFDREKGVHELLAAFAALAADYPELDLVMAGDGEEKAALEKTVLARGLAARVFFPGYIGGDDKGRLLRDCRVFALPTSYRREGMPVAMLEAMAAGKPLLIGAAGAIRAVVKDPENGVVLTEVTAATVEAGLRRLLADPAFAEKAGVCNAQAAREKFDARIVTAEIEQMYEKVAAC